VHPGCADAQRIIVERRYPMKRDNINYLVVGIFVIAVLGAFFIFMYFVTGRTGPADHYFVHYKNVAGLKFGTGVFYEGYHVGQIEKIVPEAAPTGMQYVLTLSVKRGWKIPEDSVARVISSGLISAVQIEIDEGVSPNIVAPGGELLGQEQQDLLAVLSEAAGEFSSLSRDGVMPVLRNLNERINEVSAEIISFRREELGSLVETFNQRLNQDLIGDAQTLISKLDDSAQQLQKILGTANQRQIEQFLIHIDDVAVNMNGLITRIETTRAQMGETLVAIQNLALHNEKELASTVRKANISMQQMQDALTTVNEHLSTIMYNVEGSTRQLHEFSQAVRDNPARLIRGSEPQNAAQ
jgi:phospholipid/cholesterol/gamma-HCH transport system substrate-binding protein